MIMYLKTRKKKANPVYLSNVLNSVIRDLRWEHDIYFEQLKKHWESIVGTAGAKNTHPVLFNKSTLTIAVSSPVWLTQARFYKSSFIEKINAFKSQNTMVVSDIVFTLDKSQ